MSENKICVYAISKNEAQFVERWYNSMKEADAIYVLDTGSTDNTVSLLKKKNIIVSFLFLPQTDNRKLKAQKTKKKT